MIDPNMESVPYPSRKITFTFEHDTIGDGVFCPMLYAAMEEMRVADPHGELEQFTASNDVRITVTWPPERSLEQFDADVAAYLERLKKEGQ
ncbi:hypothetical protein FHR70_001512 [Microvirga lupini]|uniref:Uncharacterized protein n=1 Tax=Microvirga lupini TaxID=420324 RepID=A0A7W4YWZ3_9HYPH|nr:hypothetical protein [Microvirga lupini]MBB3018458.1 hypothetical protein [Microvirga lupini]